MTEKIRKEVESYLRDFGATDEEMKCVRMWVRDGHNVYENDYPGLFDEDESNTDFLTASRFVSFWNKDYTDSFYDPMTQEYIRKLKPTRYERRKLREHIRNGGRFRVGHVYVNEMVDFITYIRTCKEELVCAFDCRFGHWISKYGAEYLICRHRYQDFVRFLEGKEDYIKDNMPYEKSAESGDEMPF